MSKKQKYRDFASADAPILSDRTDKKQPASGDFISEASEKRDRFNKISKQLQAYKNSGKNITKVKC